VYALRDVLAELPLPPTFNAANVSSKWRCVLAPAVETFATVVATAEDLLLSEEALMTYLEAGIPVRGHAERAAPVYANCGGNGVEWLTKGPWNTFPKPQIALRRGWGAPGTDMQVSSFHKMIGSFDEVFHHKQEVEVRLTEQEMKEAAAARAAEEGDDTPSSPCPNLAPAAMSVESPEGEVLDLQLFHRDDGCPVMPVLGERLLWPSFVDDGAVCDTATWASQKGMIRHWHLNDSGEFAMQAALPLIPTSSSSASSPPAAREGCSGWLHDALTPVARKMRSLMCPAMAAAAAVGNATHHTPAMVTIFAPKGGYDWVLHDDESTMRGKVVALDLFATPDEALPCDAAVLPILTVAVLESGGAPLITPPNLPQLSLALQDCVVVEQRRVCNLWLDDVSYFLHRCARWQTNPIIYSYLQQELQDDAFIAGQVIPLLIRVFAEHSADTSYHAAVRRRVVCSLYALAANDKHFGLSEATRRSLLSLLQGGNASMRMVLQSPPYRPTTADVPSSLEAWLSQYWDMSWCWPKAGCVLRTPNTVFPVGTKLTAVQQRPHYVPVVYPVGTCCPVYGSEEVFLEGTVQQYFKMKQLELKLKDLLAYLRTRKQPPDDLLEELF
jgi:hypothetical protein